MYIYMASGLEFWLQNYSKEAKGKGLRLHRNDEISFNFSGTFLQCEEKLTTHITR